MCCPFFLLSVCCCRLLTVGCYSFVWAKREQAPQSNGTADVSVVGGLELSAAEVAAMAPHEFEFGAAAAQAWIAPSDILAGKYHPALKRTVQDYIKLCKFKELEALLLGGDITAVPPHPLPPHMAAATPSSPLPLSDAALLEKARAFFQYHRFIAQNDTQTVQCEETE